MLYTIQKVYKINKRSKVMQRRAFTLAEVLITLGIVGTVAAITLPILTNNITARINSEKEANIAQKITKSMEMMRANGLLDSRYENTDAFVNELSKYLKISKRCNANELTNCWPVKVVTNAAGKEFQVEKAKTGKHINLSHNDSDNVGLILADGTSLILTYNNQDPDLYNEDSPIRAVNKELPLGFGKKKNFPYTTDVTSSIAYVVDVNGAKSPNKEDQSDNKIYDIRSFRGASFARENLCGENFIKFKSLAMQLDGEEGDTLECLNNTTLSKRKAACVFIFNRPTNNPTVSSSYNYNTGTIDYYVACCLAKGTMITLADGSEKPIEYITYDDELLVWDFDNGKFASAKPAWLMQPKTVNKHILLTYSNGSQLKSLHRVYNRDTGMFADPLTKELSIGAKTMISDGSEASLISQEEIPEETIYYNIITEKHFNCFANGIFTSSRFSNMYPIKDDKYVKTKRETIAYDEYSEYVSYEMYEKLRLGELPRGLISYQYLYSLRLTSLPKLKKALV